MMNNEGEKIVGRECLLGYEMEVSVNKEKRDEMLS